MIRTNETYCSNCKFYDPMKSNDEGSPGWGRCHRYAPTPNWSDDFLWPSVQEDDWCGEFEEKDE